MDDDLAHEELVLVQLDVGRSQMSIRTEKSGKLKSPKLEGRTHYQPHQRPEKQSFFKFDSRQFILKVGKVQISKSNGRWKSKVGVELWSSLKVALEYRGRGKVCRSHFAGPPPLVCRFKVWLPQTLE